MQKEATSKGDSYLVSAVITTYNRPETAKRAITSVLNQTYDHMEIIVVEDGSSSGLDGWIKQEGYGDIIYSCHPRNKGLAAARNTGLRLANGDYIAYLDDDDEWKPTRVEKQVHLINTLSGEEKNRLGVVCCGTETRFIEGDEVVFNYPKNRGKLKESIKREGASTLNSVFLFDKKALEKIGGFDENLPSSIDHDIWMSLATGGFYAYNVYEPLVIVYNKPNQKTMMKDTCRRISGVQMYVEKWMPIYQEWFGKREGKIYGQRYFAKVIALLAGDKIMERNIAEAYRASKSIFKFSKQYKYNAAILAKVVAVNSLRVLLPVKLFKRLVFLKQRPGVKKAERLKKREINE